jgi:Ca-activated chloride channel family protein
MDLFADIELRSPLLALTALSAVPVFLLARRAGGRVLYSSLGALPGHTGSWRTALAWLPDLLLALAAASLGLALAGPRTGDKESRIRSEGIAIVMAVDISSSMRALDLSTEDEKRTRLDAVKEVFEEFVLGSDDGELGGRPDDAIGVVSFARYADTRAPLTLDHQMVVRVARDLAIVSRRGEDGTALGDGLGLAVDRLRDSKAASRVAILLTDGVNNTGVESPLAAAELARKEEVKVYTVGAGTNGMAPIEVVDPFTGRPTLRSVPVEIDEETLTKIAETTGGRYFRATDADSLRKVYSEIDELERTELDETRYLDYDEHYGVLVGLGMLLALLGWLGRATLWRRLP